MTASAEVAGTATAVAARKGKSRLGRLPIHLGIIGLMVIWLIPTIGLFINSLRPSADVNDSGWWTAIFEPSQ